MRLDSMRLDSVGPRTWLLATLAGWALLAWLLALLGMGGHVAPLARRPGAVRRLPQPQPSPPARLGPLAQYAEIGARPLFSDDRRPQPFSLQPDGEGEATANTFDCRPDQRADHAGPAAWRSCSPPAAASSVAMQARRIVRGRARLAAGGAGSAQRGVRRARGPEDAGPARLRRQRRRSADPGERRDAVAGNHGRCHRPDRRRGAAGPPPPPPGANARRQRQPRRRQRRTQQP